MKTKKRKATKFTTLLEAATPLPWEVKRVPRSDKKMSAVVGANEHLVAGSLIAQVDAQRIADHKLMVHAVNRLGEAHQALGQLAKFLRTLQANIDARRLPDVTLIPGSPLRAETCA